MATIDRGNDSWNNHSWRDFSFPLPVVPKTLISALDHLIICVERHRLLFLYAAVATSEGIIFPQPSVEIPEEHIDNQGLFLLEYRAKIEFKIDDIISNTAPFDKEFSEEWVTYWRISGWACYHLEQSSNSIIQACAFLRNCSNDYAINELLKSATECTHDGCIRWYSAMSVKWSYPGKLDCVIRDAKLALAAMGDSGETAKPRTKEPDGEIKPSEDKFAPLWVKDLDLNDYVQFNPREVVKMGEYSSYRGDYVYSLYMSSKQQWIELTTGYDDPEIRRISTEDAVKTLMANGLSVPSQFRDIAKKYKFDPSCEIKRKEADAKAVTAIIWNKELGELRVNGDISKSIKSTVKAKNVVMILNVFQEDGWPERVDSPFTNGEKLRDSIKSLNENLKFLEFRADGNGEGIIMKVLDLPRNSREVEPDFGDVPF